MDCLFALFWLLAAEWCPAGPPLANTVFTSTSGNPRVLFVRLLVGVSGPEDVDDADEVEDEDDAPDERDPRDVVTFWLLSLLSVPFMNL